MNVCELLNTVANSNNDRLIYITNSLFAAYFSMCHPSLTFHFPSFSQCIQNESKFCFQCRGPYFVRITKLYNLRKRVVSTRIRIAVSPGIWNFKVKRSFDNLT